MAKVRSNLLVQGLSGKLGDQVVFRTLRDGRTIVCAKPDFSHRKLSKNQKEHHKRFKAAAAYARDAAHRQHIYAELAAGTMKNAYNVALGDWFHPPQIQQVKRRGATIQIQASDDVCVAGVQVMVLDKAGKTAEMGEAVQTETSSISSGWWEYVTTAKGQVIVEARDLAGNRVKAELGSSES